MQYNISNTQPDTLFWKFFSNEATEEEKSELLNWVKESDSNKKTFQQARTAYIYARHNGEIDSFNSVNAFDKLNKKLQPKKTIALWKKLSAAASIAILLGIGITFYVIQKEPVAPMSYNCKNNEIKNIILPDSSKITLHRLTSLQYDLQATDCRKTTLSGEAFFDIVHDASKPFSITINELEIRVLGTSFIVEADPSDNYVSVRVLSGRVMISTKTHSQIISANQMAIYYKESGTIATMESFNKNDIAWKTHELEFNATPLSVVAQKFSDYFNKKFIVEDSLMTDYKLTASFSSPELNSVLKLMELTFNIKTEQKDSVIILSRN